jgi:hypothetical protein
MTMESETQLLARFPKLRPPLPEAFQKIYVDHYVRNRAGASPASAVAKRLESWMHRQVAADVVSSREPPHRTLEIGSGSLNHLEYEPLSGQYDVVEPFIELATNSPHRLRVSQSFRELSEITDTTYDRIISIAAFEHLTDLPTVVARCGTLLSEGGQLRVAIPSEGTLLWGLGWRLSTGIEFWLRHRLDYGVLMRHEHLNTADEIFRILRVFFQSVRRQSMGLVPALSLYQFFECRSPDRNNCSRYLTRDPTM